MDDSKERWRAGSFREQTISMIDRRMIEAGVSQRMLADRLKLSEAAVSQMLSSNRNLTLRSVDRILDAIRNLKDYSNG